MIEKKLSGSEGNFQCTDCRYVNDRQCEIVNHIQVAHLPNFPGYKCPHCGKHLLSISELEKHLKNDHGPGQKSPTSTPSTARVDKMYKCPVLQCQMSLTSRADFDIHIKSVHQLSLKFRDDTHTQNHIDETGSQSKISTSSSTMVSTIPPSISNQSIAHSSTTATSPENVNSKLYTQSRVSSLDDS